jgi:FAD/FMN-containing dehydrogenase
MYRFVRMAESIDLSAASPLPILHRDSTDGAAFHEAVWGRVFNQRRDTTRQPRAVVRVSDRAHVKAAVELAEKENCRVSVRSGGHSWAAWSVRDDAILLDLAWLRDLEYDDQTKVVTCSPSRTGRETNNFLAEKGRMFPGGHCPDVGLGGFLLQGGMGWNCKVRSPDSNMRGTYLTETRRTGVGLVNTSLGSTL